MTPKELKNQLHALRDVRGNINPRADFVHETRQHLLDTLSHTVADTKKKRFSLEHLWEAMSVVIPSRAVYTLVRPTVMVLAVFSLATGTWITGAFASLDSKSGEFLYPVKIGIEKTTETVVGLTQGEAAKTKVKAENLSRRVEEAKALVTEAAERGNETDVAEHVDKTLKRFKEDMAEVNQSMDDLKTQDIAAAVEVAKAVDQSSEKITAILDDTQSAIVKNNTMIPQEVKVIVAEAASATAETEKKTVEVYLETLEKNGEQVITKEEVKRVIDKKIERIERAVDATQQNVRTVNEAVQNNPEALQEEKERVIEPTQQIVEKTGEVKEALQEARQLLQEDNFTEVVKRVQELTPITQEVKKKSAEVEKVVEQINADKQSNATGGETSGGGQTSSSTPAVSSTPPLDTFVPNNIDVKETEVRVVE